MNKKWTITIIVLLMMLNIASIGFMWWRNGPPRMDRKQEQRAAEYIIHELKLDSSQQLAYKALLNEHHQQMRDAEEQIMKSKDAFFDLLKQDKVDSIAELAAAANIGTAEENINLLTLHHFAGLKAICNEEQKKQLAIVLKNVLRKMKPHPMRNDEDPNRPPPPPPRDRGEDPNDFNPPPRER